jgi:hypothetical protein
MRRAFPVRGGFMHTLSMETRLELSLLAVLAPGPRPAKTLLDEARRRGGAETAAPVFDALRGLERAGLVARGPWRLTAHGRARLARERSAWAGLARAVAAALSTAPPRQRAATRSATPGSS